MQKRDLIQANVSIRKSTTELGHEGFLQKEILLEENYNKFISDHTNLHFGFT